MSGRLLKCYGDCGEKYPKELLTKYKSKNYCEACLKKKQERDADYDKLCEYICEIFNAPFVNPYIKKQIADYEKGGFTLKGIRSTLKYIVEILGVTLKEEYGIAMVKYKYYEAKKFAENLNKQKGQNKEIKEEKMVKYINISKEKQGKPPKKKFSLGDIKLEEEDK